MTNKFLHQKSLSGTPNWGSAQVNASRMAVSNQYIGSFLPLKFFATFLVLFAFGIGSVWGAITALSLPKTWADNADVSNYSEANGCTQNSLGNYNSTSLKFDGTGDYLLIQLADSPDKLGYKLKTNGSSTSTYKFEILESVNGSSWSPVKTYNSAPSGTDDVSNLQLSSSTRYIKFLYTTKPSGINMGLYGVSISKASASCNKKVTLTKGSQSNGTFSLNKTNGSYDNCDANFVVTVSSISANSGFYCSGVTATGGNSEITGPDGSGNYTVTYTKGNNITSTITANFAPKTARTVTFMNNGVQYGNVVNLYDGDAVGTLPSGPTSCDNNKVFVGWSETNIGITPTNTAPTFITASTVVSGSNKVYHAVFATDATPAGNLFSWTGSSTNDLASLTGMTGVTSSGLGSYAAGNAPYRVQFDNSSDYLTISLSSAPSTLTLTTKKLGGAGNSSFTIQESTASNGTFTDVQTFTCTGAQNATASFTTNTAFKSTTRAVKITFSKATSGNTGVGSIIITPATSYSGYITGCCTPLAQINGSINLSHTILKCNLVIYNTSKVIFADRQSLKT